MLATPATQAGALDTHSATLTGAARVRQYIHSLAPTDPRLSRGCRPSLRHATQRPQTLAHCRVHVRAHRRPSVTSAPTHQVRVCEFMQPWPQHTRNSVSSPHGNLAILPNAAGLSGRSVCMQRYAAYAHSARSPWPRVPCVHAQHVPFIRGSSLSLVSAPTDCRHCHVRCHTAPAAGPSVYVVASTRGSLAHPALRHRSSLAPDLTGEKR